MSISDHFSLPYIGMKDGVHQYRFTAGNDFFSNFENSPVNEGEFNIMLEVNKRAGMSELDFKIDGYVAATCDRCLAEIKLPVHSEYNILVKVGNSVSDDDEVMYIKEDQSHLDLSQLVYEFICLSLPIVNIYDCDNELTRVCNDDVLNKLKNRTEETEDAKLKGNIWESLKGINPDN